MWKSMLSVVVQDMGRSRDNNGHQLFVVSSRPDSVLKACRQNYPTTIL